MYLISESVVLLANYATAPCYSTSILHKILSCSDHLPYLLSNDNLVVLCCLVPLEMSSRPVSLIDDPRGVEKESNLLVGAPRQLPELVPKKP